MYHYDMVRKFKAFKYYLKHCHQFVQYEIRMQLNMKCEWQIWHEARPNATFITRLSLRAA